MILPDAALGSIIAAAIAGLVVFISTVLTKEQKTSEFRQSWIDELRKEISQFIAGASEIITLHKYKLGDEDAYKKFIDENFKIIQELQVLEHRIVLRLNPDEHLTLIEQVKSFRKNMLKAYQLPEPAREAREEEITKKLIDTTKDVLKSEWRRVKDGEPTFQWVKKGGLVTMIALLILLVFFVIAGLTGPASKKKDEQKDGPRIQLIQSVIKINKNEIDQPPKEKYEKNKGNMYNKAKSASPQIQNTPAGNLESKHSDSSK